MRSRTPLGVQLGWATALLVAAIGVTALTATALPAQRGSTAARGARDSVTAAPGAPVVLNADTLFRLDAPLGPFSAAARAAVVTERIRAVAKALAAGDSIVVAERGTYSELAVGDVVVMTVLDEDARPIGATHAALAARYAVRIRSAALAAVERRSARALFVGAGYAALATVILVLLLWLLSIAATRGYHRIETLRRVRIPAIKIQDFELLSAGRLSGILVASARILRVVLTLLLLYVYVPLVLSFFPWTTSLSEQITGYALRPFAVAWSGFVAYLPNLFYLAAGVVIVRYLLAFLHLFFGAMGSGSIKLRGFYSDWAEPTYKIVRVLVFAFAAIALYPYLPGASSDAFKGVSIFVGVLFSLGSSAAIGNMVAGVVLTYTRAFQIGDRVKIGETVGDVTEKTLLVTRVRTIKHVAVTIPNGTVLSSQVVNYTTLAASRGLILHTSVTIGYDAPWRQVESLLVEAARRTEHILPDPTPFVLQTSLDDFYVSYEINAFSDRADLMAVTYSALHRNIQDTFNEGGVEIMSPHYGALRDGNQTTIPASYLAPGQRAPAFRVEGITEDQTASAP